MLTFYRAATSRETNLFSASYTNYSQRTSKSYKLVEKYKYFNYWHCDERFPILSRCGTILKPLGGLTFNDSHCGIAVKAWYKESSRQWCYVVGILKKYSDEALDMEIVH